MTFRALIKMNGFHFNCRNKLYPFSQVQRFAVPDNKVSWGEPYEEYDPPDYTAPNLDKKPWADPDIEAFSPNFNSLDTSKEVPIDRRSRSGIYKIKDNRPVNPEGRTGIKGRGALGRWGPNQAADPVVTRWKREKSYIVMHHRTSKPILQFCAIKRKDTGEWAIPGGMVDAGEAVSETLKREFAEEVLNIENKNEDNAKSIKKMVSEFFANGVEVYAGYVDDHRNTDNAWMETVVQNFHDETGQAVGSFPLQAGSDAAKVQWVDIDKDIQLYASHANFIKTIATLKQAHL